MKKSYCAEKGIKCPHCGKRIKEKDFNSNDSFEGNKKEDDMVKKKVDCRTKKGRETSTCKRKVRKTLSKKPARKKQFVSKKTLNKFFDR